MRIIFFLFCSCIVFGQNSDFELLKKVNGVEIYYKQSIVKPGDKKDRWVIEFEFVNKTQNDIFYTSYIQQPTALQSALGDKPTINARFAYIYLENSKEISFTSDSEIGLRGDKTKLKTSSDDIIVVLKKNKVYTSSMDFRAEKGVIPVLTVDINRNISFVESLLEFL